MKYNVELIPDDAAYLPDDMGLLCSFGVTSTPNVYVGIYINNEASIFDILQLTTECFSSDFAETFLDNLREAVMMTTNPTELADKNDGSE